MIPPGVVHATDKRDGHVSATDNKADALPSVGSGQYLGIMTSKNFTDITNSHVLSVPTTNIHPVSGGAAKPGVRKEDDMSGVRLDDASTKEVVTPKCSYTGKGICLLHGPGAKLRWKPRMKKVTDKKGVTRLVKLDERHYFYVCNLGPRVGKGTLKQTSISMVSLHQPGGGGREILLIETQLYWEIGRLLQWGNRVEV